MANTNREKKGVSRREFLETSGKLGFAALIAQGFSKLAFGGEENPLFKKVGRDWEQIYRDLFKVDSTFNFLCAPNDTHNCLLTGYVKNGVVVRIGPSFGYGKATDLEGNRPSARWDPRCCQKGLALTRRFYGDRRVRGPMIRDGFLKWANDGFPRDPETGKPLPGYHRRAHEHFKSVSWDEATDVVAKALKNIAETYSGDQGVKRLQAQKVDPACIEAMQGAGTRSLKFRGGMPLLGMTRVFGLYRMANSMALLDSQIRGVGPDEAKGASGFDNYSWHTDLPPGHPMVTGQQTVDFDLSAAEHCKLLIVWGMNWIATKMPDAHWLTEARAQGTKIVVIACEYSSTSSKADQAIIVRPGTTPALALGLAQVVIAEKLYDEKFVKRFTDLPLLVRMDTLTMLRAKDVVAGYENKDLKRTTVLKEGEKALPPWQQVDQVLTTKLRDEFGDHVCWDTVKGEPAVLTRDDVGKYFDETGIDPSLAGEYTITLVDGKKVQARPVFDLVKQYLDDSCTPEAVEAITWAPKSSIISLAKDIAANNGQTLFAVGMGPNQFFNNDQKDRTQFLLAALTGSVG